MARGLSDDDAVKNVCEHFDGRWHELVDVRTRYQ